MALGALQEEYPADKIRVASMGAIEKPDGSVRPVHDGTHGVLVNNGIHLVNHVSVPGPAEMAFAVRQARRSERSHCQWRQTSVPRAGSFAYALVTTAYWPADQIPIHPPFG